MARDPAEHIDTSDPYGKQLADWLDRLARPARLAWGSLLAHAAGAPKKRAGWPAWMADRTTRSVAEAVEPHLHDTAASVLTRADLATHAFDPAEGRYRPLGIGKANRELLGGVLLALAPLGDPSIDARLEALLLACWVKVPDVGAAAPRLGLQVVTAMAHGTDASRVRLVKCMDRLKYDRPVSAAWDQLALLAPEGASANDFRVLLLARTAREDLLVGVLRDLWKQRLQNPRWATGLHAPTLLAAATTRIGRKVIGGLVWEVDGTAVQVRDGGFVDLDGRPIPSDERVHIWVAGGDATARWLDRLASSQPFAQIAIDSRGRSTLADTLAAIEADPTDLSLRAVYADQLQQAGDPRGELIALQLAGGRPTPRERELLAAHGRTWLGELDAHLASKPLVYKNGFLYECRLQQSWSRLPSSPVWATVEVLHCDLERQLPPREHATALREIYALRNVPDETWPQVRVFGYGRPTWAHERMDIDSLSRIQQAFPGLEVLDMSHCPLSVTLWPEIEGWGLKEVRVWTGPFDVAAWHAIASAPGGPRVRLTHALPAKDRRHIGWEWVLDGHRLTLRRGLQADLPDLHRWLDGVERLWDHVVLDSPKKDDPAVAALHSWGVEVERAE